MPSMKGFGNRMIDNIKKRTGTGLGGSSKESSPSADTDSPEGAALHALKQFCEHGGPNNQGDEVLYLPPIVEAAESSPAAAAECARQIRRYLSKDYKAKTSWQYNAIMIMRILVDNPGYSFTRNLDKKFIDTVKDLLKANRDPSVQQMLMETLEDFEQNKWQDEGLAGLIALWRAEKGRVTQQNRPPQPIGLLHSQSWQAQHQQQNYFSRHHTNRKLPNPVELASRLEEARTSAKLLSQVVINTPPQELLDNELVKEFADRCQSASRSIQLYMVAEDPAPDNETMESLINVNEQLQTSLSQHQRAVLGARKQLGLNSRTNSNNISSPGSSPQMTNGQPPSIPPNNTRPQLLQQQSQVSSSSSTAGPQVSSSRKPVNNGKGKDVSPDSFQPPPGPPPGMVSSSGAGASGANRNAADDDDDPFRDPQPESEHEQSAPKKPLELPTHAYEPFNPGFASTNSYLNRQESAYEHTTMHGGESGASPYYSQGQNKTQGPGVNSNNVHDDEDIYESNDLYDSTPKRGQASR